MCEHWYSPDTIAYAHLEGYNLASAYCRTVKSRGGVAIYVRDGIDFHTVNVEDFCIEGTCEAVAATVNLGNYTVRLVSIYRIPGSDLDLFLNSLEQLILFLSTPRYAIIICGDININILNVNEVATRDLQNTLRSVDCYYANNKPTRGLACLDNIITNLPRGTLHVEVAEPISDHLALSVNLSISQVVLDKKAPDQMRIRCFNEGNINKFLNFLLNINWDTVLLSKGVPTCAFDKFMDIFIKGMSLCFPVKTVNKKKKSRSMNRKWFTDEHLKMKRDVESLHGKLQWSLRYNLFVEESKARYSEAKAKYKRALHLAKIEANGHLINTASNKVKKAWEITNALRKTSTVPKDDITLTAENFNSYFTSSVAEITTQVGRSLATAMDLLSNNQGKSAEFHWTPVSCEQVADFVRDTKSSKSKDIFDISSEFAKKVLPTVLLPLTTCINQCLITGVFPESFKLSKVVPIYKKGDKSSPSSYRPISVVPIISKILEKVVKHQVSEFFESNSLFSEFQFGFRPGKSTVDAVEGLVRSVLNSFEGHSSTLATLCDLSKAFDCVPHKILVSKLKFYGMSGVELQFFESYLTNRKQSVFFNNSFSEVVSVSSGVPQGSVLGPLLFLVLINDLPSSLSCNSIIFADDTTLYSSSPNSNFDELSLTMSNAVIESNIWFRANGLSLNEGKTQNILFTLSKNPLSLELGDNTNVKLLGIVLDPSLNWNPHIQIVCSRLSRVIFLLRQLRNVLPNNFLKNAYFAFFHSIILYGISVWGNSPHIVNVLKLQKKAIRILTKSSFNAHCRPLFIAEGILTVVNVFIFICLCKVKVKLNVLKPRSDGHNHDTRHKWQLDLPFCRLSLSQDWLDSVSLRMFNRLPLCVHFMSISKFKLCLHKFLVNRPFYHVKEFHEVPVNDFDLVFT